MWKWIAVMLLVAGEAAAQTPVAVVAVGKREDVSLLAMARSFFDAVAAQRPGGVLREEEISRKLGAPTR
jgi:hypothetical protein